MTIRIVTDSSCDLPSNLINRHGITVLPCYVIVDDETFKDGVEIQADDFYSRLQMGGRTPRLLNQLHLIFKKSMVS